MRELKVMHDKTTSTKLQGIGTNHKSLQSTEYKLIYIYIYIYMNQNTTHFKRPKNIHEFKPNY